MVGSHLIHKTSECLVQLLMMDPPKSVLGLINFNVSVPHHCSNAIRVLLQSKFSPVIPVLETTSMIKWVM